jgi:uncharacterized protein YndB with AHSA1/START domain
MKAGVSRKLWLAALGIFIVVGGLAGAGAALDEAHVASLTARYPAAPEAVFGVITDFERMPSWRADLERVEILSDPGEPIRFREHGEFGVITFEVDELTPPTRLVTRIADPDLAFGGRWIVQVSADGDGSRVTITERGEIKNPIFRVLSRFVYGYDSSLRSYLQSLGTELGSPVEPENAAPLT